MKLRRFIQLSGKLAFLGLLGIPMFFSDWAGWRFFWLFWLLALAQIIFAPRFFVQLLQQMGGLIIAEVKHKPLPDMVSFTPKVRYSSPFEGKWAVINGGVSKETSHSWDIFSQRYAYDFIILQENSDSIPKSFGGDIHDLTSYYCYDKEVLAPADGVVVDVRKNCGDSLIMGCGKTDPIVKDIRGNYITIRHAEGEYTVLAHLKPGSISVKVGDEVKGKQPIARCGNSGNSTEPHLHFQLQNTRSFYTSAGLPLHFEGIESEPISNYAKLDPRPTEDVTPPFISRGRRIWNQEEAGKTNE